MPEYSNKLVVAPFSSHDFPDVMAQRSILDGSLAANFKNSICHRCNAATPNSSWCIPMYGGLFKQKYGWYIQQARLKMGIAKDWKFLTDSCPEDFARDIQQALRLKETAEIERNKLMVLVAGEPRTDIAPDEVVHWRNVKVHEAENDRLAQKLSDRTFRQLENRFENDARAEFGIRKVGDAWLGETLLYVNCSSIASE